MARRSSRGAPDSLAPKRRTRPRRHTGIAGRDRVVSRVTDRDLRTGRGGEIRTRDHLHPMQVRYQAALRPDASESITEACTDFRTAAQVPRQRQISLTTFTSCLSAETVTARATAARADTDHGVA